MSIYCPYTNGNVVYLKCQECEDKTCEKGWFFCGVGGTPLSMMKCRKQMSEYLDKMLAKREKVVIAAESGKKMAALAAMYASEHGYLFVPVAKVQRGEFFIGYNQQMHYNRDAAIAKKREKEENTIAMSAVNTVATVDETTVA